MKCNLIIYDWFKLSNSKEFPVLFLRGKVFGLQDKQVQVLPAMQMFSPPSALKRQVGLGGSGGSRAWVTRVSWTPSLSSIPGVLGLRALKLENCRVFSKRSNTSRHYHDQFLVSMFCYSHYFQWLQLKIIVPGCRRCGECGFLQWAVGAPKLPVSCTWNRWAFMEDMVGSLVPFTTQSSSKNRNQWRIWSNRQCLASVDLAGWIRWDSKRSGFSTSTMLPRSTATGSLLASSLRTVRSSISRMDTVNPENKISKSPGKNERPQSWFSCISDISDIHHILCCWHSPASKSSCFKIWDRFFYGSDLVLDHICSVGQEDRLSSASACDTLGFTTSGTTNYFLIGSCLPQSSKNNCRFRSPAMWFWFVDVLFCTHSGYTSTTQNEQHFAPWHVHSSSFHQRQTHTNISSSPWCWKEFLCCFFMFFFLCPAKTTLARLWIHMNLYHFICGTHFAEAEGMSCNNGQRSGVLNTMIRSDNGVLEVTVREAIWWHRESTLESIQGVTGDESNPIANKFSVLLNFLLHIFGEFLAFHMWVHVTYAEIQNYILSIFCQASWLMTVCSFQPTLTLFESARFVPASTKPRCMFPWAQFCNPARCVLKMYLLVSLRCAGGQGDVNSVLSLRHWLIHSHTPYVRYVTDKLNQNYFSQDLSHFFVQVCRVEWICEDPFQVPVTRACFQDSSFWFL